VLVLVLDVEVLELLVEDELELVLVVVVVSHGTQSKFMLLQLACVHVCGGTHSPGGQPAPPPPPCARAEGTNSAKNDAWAGASPP
jgi:hypothetical protein